MLLFIFVGLFRKAFFIDNGRLLWQSYLCFPIIGSIMNLADTL
jgi:hypothetical protein